MEKNDIEEDWDTGGSFFWWYEHQNEHPKIETSRVSDSIWNPFCHHVACPNCSESKRPHLLVFPSFPYRNKSK